MIKWIRNFHVSIDWVCTLNNRENITINTTIIIIKLRHIDQSYYKYIRIYYKTECTICLRTTNRLKYNVI